MTLACYQYICCLCYASKRTSPKCKSEIPIYINVDNMQESRHNWFDHYVIFFAWRNCYWETLWFIPSLVSTLLFFCCMVVKCSCFYIICPWFIVFIFVLNSSQPIYHMAKGQMRKTVPNINPSGFTSWNSEKRQK